MKIAFKTFGCKANAVDGDVLFHEAVRRGHEVVVEDDPAADAYVINTCTVTETADREAYSLALKLKRRQPNALVGMVGCYAQVGKDELLQSPAIDFVVGTADKIRVLSCLEAAHGGERLPKDQVVETAGFLSDEFPGSRYARAPIKIQDGCNFSCSYCIIPAARGRSRSLPPQAVLKQIREAYAQGFREVVLTGIHLAHYGWDEGSDLSLLLDEIFAEEPGPRVRLSTLDPFELPDGLIERLTYEPRLCPHFHIALQSGNDRVLKSMRRIYRAAEFAEVTEKIAKANADTFIGVDVIVGFPGETESEFQETLHLLEATPWAKLHVFPFSAREGTKAAEMADAIPVDRIRERSSILRALSEERYHQFLSSQLGKTRSVVFERPHSTSGLWLGHTDNYLPVLAAYSGQTKALHDVRLVEVRGDKVFSDLLLN